MEISANNFEMTDSVTNPGGFRGGAIVCLWSTHMADRKQVEAVIVGASEGEVEVVLAEVVETSSRRAKTQVMGEAATVVVVVVPEVRFSILPAPCWRPSFLRKRREAQAKEGIS